MLHELEVTVEDEERGGKEGGFAAEARETTCGQDFLEAWGEAEDEDEEGAPSPPGFSFCSSSSCRFKAFSWASRRPMRS